LCKPLPDVEGDYVGDVRPWQTYRCSEAALVSHREYVETGCSRYSRLYAPCMIVVTWVIGQPQSC
jgi:hypothetical protein